MEENDIVVGGGRDGTIPTKTYSFERYGRRTFGNNITNRQTQSSLDGIQDAIRGLSKKGGDVVMQDAVLTPHGDVSKGSVYDVFQTPRDEQGPPSEGKRLAREMHAMAERLGTPTGRGSVESRSLASASTEELKRPVARRMSILGDMHAPILDLNGFDANGDRRRHSLATPVIQRTKEEVPTVPSTSDEDVQELRAKVKALEAQRDEAGVILEGYQGSIAKLQDDYSKDVVTWTTENTLMSTEVDRLRKERQRIHDQFSVLYHKKYLPLKEEAENLRNAHAKQESLHVQSLQEEVGMFKKQVESYQMSEIALKKSVEAIEAQLLAAKEEIRIECNRSEDTRQQAQTACQEYQSTIQALESALRQRDQKIDSVERKILSMREQLDEALHEKEVATTGFQRKTCELQAREEEVYSLQANLNEKMKLLEEYKRTNEGFYEIKLGYKKKIQYLNAKLAEEREKAR